MSDMDDLHAAAHANNGDAQYELGIAYMNGDGVPRDFAEAYFWLTVCEETKGVFWSPSPGELAADAVLHLDEASLGAAMNRAILWLADHGTPTPGDD
jgi:Sel1 repeat